MNNQWFVGYTRTLSMRIKRIFAILIVIGLLVALTTTVSAAPRFPQVNPTPVVTWKITVNLASMPAAFEALYTSFADGNEVATASPAALGVGLKRVGLCKTVACRDRSVYTVATAIIPVYAALGDQKIVRRINASKGWTTIVPMDIDLGNDGLTDLLSYNATTGLAVYSVATNVPGDQKTVRLVNASKGWTSVVPMNIDSSPQDIDHYSLTDLLSYNATTGFGCVFQLTASAQREARKTVRDWSMSSKGWTSIVPMNINNDGLTDLLSYNATTGLAVYSVATNVPGDQKKCQTDQCVKRVDFYCADEHQQ